MKSKLQLLLVGLATASLLACGGEDDNVDNNGEEQTETECGEGTVLDEETDQCVLDLEPLDCEDNEIYLEEFHRCALVAENYCAEGTELDENTGQCTADAELECAENTAEQDSECVAGEQTECGEGTVVQGGLCVPFADVCAEGTEGDPPSDDCRPVEGICGENTTFDVGDRVCIPDSDISCGPGTEEVDNICEPTQSFFDELAENPDLDVAGVDGPHNMTLPATGERTVFVGNIEAPDEVDGDYIQHEDVFEFSGDAGQWVTITVYSLGLPEPGFTVADSADFYRLSDVAQGNETTRTVVLPQDGTYELAVSNLPQLRGDLGPAGGEDWGYVGYVETQDAPTPTDVDLLDETLSGDITELEDNFYAVSALSGIDDVLMVLDAVPGDADGELQIWSDATTIDQVVPLEGSSTSFAPPAGDFFLLFDYVHAEGTDLLYSTQASQAAALADGDMLSEDFDVLAGEYVGISQFNTEEAAISAAITDGSNILAETTELAISTDESGQTTLYYLADQDMTLTLEWINETGAAIGALSRSTFSGQSDDITIESSGNRQDFDFSRPLLRGQRHYFNATVEYDGLLSMTLPDGDASGHIVVVDSNGDVAFEGTDGLVQTISPGDYTIYVEAQGTMGDGFTLRTEESTIFDVEESATPGVTVTDGGFTTETITVDNCPEILDIQVYVDITHTWLFELYVNIIHPDGTSVASLHDGTSVTGEDDIQETYPNPATPGYDSGEGLLDFIGTNGSGEWTIELEDTYDDGGAYPQSLNEWSIILECQG